MPTLIRGGAEALKGPALRANLFRPRNYADARFSFTEIRRATLAKLIRTVLSIGQSEDEVLCHEGNVGCGNSANYETVRY